MLTFSLFDRNTEVEILDFWNNMNLVKYQEIQEEIRFIYDNQYKFDIFSKNLLNADLQRFNKYMST